MTFYAGTIADDSYNELPIVAGYEYWRWFDYNGAPFLLHARPPNLWALYLTGNYRVVP